MFGRHRRRRRRRHRHLRRRRCRRREENVLSSSTHDANAQVSQRHNKILSELGHVIMYLRRRRDSFFCAVFRTDWQQQGKKIN